MSSSKQRKQQSQPLEIIVLCGKCAAKPLKGVTFKNCAGCGLVAYCGTACQIADWIDHKSDCKLHRKDKQAKDEALKEKQDRGREREQANSKEAAAAASRDNGSGVSGLKDMGSIMAALMPPQKQQQQQKQRRYEDWDVRRACFQGHHEELQTILRQPGLDVNWALPESGGTAAHAATEQGHDKCLTLLSQYPGVDLSKTKKNGFAPIHAACQQGRYACIVVLLSNGVDANLPMADKYRNTPAMLCCMNGHVKCLALLSDRGADLSAANKCGFTAAHYACQAGELKSLQLLISRGASVNEVNIDGDTPLDIARVFKQPECVDLLLAIGASGQNIEDLRPVSEATKEFNVDFGKGAKDRQREVRQCEYPACQVKAKDGATLLKCAECRSALYCCKDHAVLHRPEHESLCKELTRLCDYPGCEERGEEDHVTCRQCKVATYCSKKHREKHSTAHESSGVCEELRALRKNRNK